MPQGRREGRSRERGEREGRLREMLWWRRGRRGGEPSVRWMVEERVLVEERWRASARLGVVSKRSYWNWEIMNIS